MHKQELADIQVSTSTLLVTYMLYIQVFLLAMWTRLINMSLMSWLTCSELRNKITVPVVTTTWPKKMGLKGTPSRYREGTA